MANRLELIRIFGVAASAASFRDAAARLGISPQVVTRAVRELEDMLGETLFHRNTRSVQITTFGERFLLQSQAVLGSMGSLFNDARDDDEMGGVVRITAPGGLGRRYVMPLLNETMKKHPGIVIDLRLSDVPSAVVNEQIDIGVRAGVIRDNRFIARTVGALPMWVVGSPALITQLGEPKNTKGLATLPLTALIDRSTGRPWPWVFSRDEQMVPSAATFVTDDPEAELGACVAGLGFGQIAAYLARSCVADGRLMRILRRVEPEPWKLSVYRPQRGPVPKRVRIVFDVLVKQLGAVACDG
jgi:DNA-binding transcriptional LysR family regulator